MTEFITTASGARVSKSLFAGTLRCVPDKDRGEIDIDEGMGERVRFVDRDTCKPMQGKLIDYYFGDGDRGVIEWAMVQLDDGRKVKVGLSVAALRLA